MNKQFMIASLAILMLFTFASFVSADSSVICSGELRYINSTTLIANDSAYAVNTPNSIEFLSTYQRVNIQGYNEAYLNNSFDLGKGRYILKFSDGAISRWDNDSTNTSRWGGAPGLTWETAAIVVYRYNNQLSMESFGQALFSNEIESEVLTRGRGISFDHSGGKMYIFIGDYPITDNRGNQTIDIYRCDSPQVVIPQDTACVWPPVNSTNEIRNMRSGYVGWAYNNKLANITFLGDNSTKIPGNYIDERLLCYNNQWHAAINEWTYYPMVVSHQVGDIVSDWKSVTDSVWIRKWQMQNHVVIPTNAACVWPPVNSSDEIRNMTSGYVGWAYNNKLANITFLGDETSKAPGNYVDERLLCYNDKWHATVPEWSYYTMVAIHDLRDKVGSWTSVTDSFWVKKWSKVVDHDDDDDNDGGSSGGFCGDFICKAGEQNWCSEDCGIPFELQNKNTQPVVYEEVSLKKNTTSTDYGVYGNTSGKGLTVTLMLNILLILLIVILILTVIVVAVRSF